MTALPGPAHGIITHLLCTPSISWLLLLLFSKLDFKSQLRPPLPLRIPQSFSSSSSPPWAQRANRQTPPLMNQLLGAGPVPLVWDPPLLDFNPHPTHTSHVPQPWEAGWLLPQLYRCPLARKMPPLLPNRSSLLRARVGR